MKSTHMAVKDPTAATLFAVCALKKFAGEIVATTNVMSVKAPEPTCPWAWRVIERIESEPTSCVDATKETPAVSELTAARPKRVADLRLRAERHSQTPPALRSGRSWPLRFCGLSWVKPMAPVITESAPCEAQSPKGSDFQVARRSSHCLR